VFYTFDERGNTAVRLEYIGSGNSSAASGQVWAPFGQQEYVTPSASAVAGDPYAGMGAQFGDYTNRETGLVFCQSRYYDPSYGRWLTRDPIGTAGGVNLYAYCHNDPINLVDPAGTMQVGTVFSEGDVSGTTSTSLGGTYAPSSGGQALQEAGEVGTGAELGEGAGLGEIAGGPIGIIMEGADAAGELAGYIASGYQPQGPLTAIGDTLGNALGNALYGNNGGTYMLINPDTGQVMRTGRSNDLDRRAREHARDPALASLQFAIDAETDSYAEQRGREQIIHDLYNPPLNKISPISPRNPRRDCYIAAGKAMKK
jgi:RHS repeat-associated protein